MAEIGSAAPVQAQAVQAQAALATKAGRREIAIFRMVIVLINGDSLISQQRLQETAIFRVFFTVNLPLPITFRVILYNRRFFRHQYMLLPHHFPGDVFRMSVSQKKFHFLKCAVRRLCEAINKIALSLQLRKHDGPELLPVQIRHLYQNRISCA